MTESAIETTGSVLDLQPVVTILEEMRDAQSVCICFVGLIVGFCFAFALLSWTR